MSKTLLLLDSSISGFDTEAGEHGIKIFAREWSARRLIPLKCGTFFQFSQEFITTYFEVLFENITNAVLIILI